MALNLDASNPQLVAGLGDAPDDWERWDLSRHRWKGAAAPAPMPMLTDRACVLPLTLGGELRMDRDRRSLDLVIPDEQPAASVVHPWLSPGFAVHVHWSGGLPLHAGVIEVNGGAWGIIGTKGAGKTTALAGLWRSGVPIIADDMAAVVGGHALGGPRYVDLRRGAAAAFPEAVAIGRAGLRQRWRLFTGAAPMRAPLAGWCVLEWGSKIRVSAVAVDERIALLAGASLVPFPASDPRALLDLAALPMVRVQRPRHLAELENASDAILGALRQAKL